MTSRLQELRRAIDELQRRQAAAIKPVTIPAEQTIRLPETASPALRTEGLAALRDRLHEPNRVSDLATRQNVARMVSAAMRQKEMERVLAAKPSVQAAREKQYGMTGREEPAAPVRPENAPPLVSARPEKQPEKRTWFEKGVYADGWQKGDLWKTIRDTATDVRENLGAGLIGMGEKALDALAYVAPLFEQGQYYQNGGVYQPPEVQRAFNASIEASKAGMSEFIKKDLYDEKEVAKKITPGTDENSVFGEKSDALIQSAGQLAGTAGLQAVGIPWFVTTGATSFGGQAETALNEGAGYEQAGASAAISAAAEVLTEKLSGGVKFGGKTLDDVLLKPLTDQIANKTWRAFANLGLDSIGEGMEEVFSGTINRLGTALYKKERLEELLLSEEALNEYIESFVGAFVLGNASSAAKIAFHERSEGILKTPAVDSVMPNLQQNKTAPGKESGAESAAQKPRISMADFTNPQSSVFRNLAYDDTVSQSAIMRQTHQDMVRNGSVVHIPERTLTQMESYYPDLRGMKKAERTPILKQKISEVKAELRRFLNGLKGVNFEFEVNGNILDAKLYDTGIKEVMEKVTQDKASMLYHSDELFQKAQYLYSTPDYDGDPNVYRWNYFYTPVQIGEEIVGVRIAVRDVAKVNESQIYNWNIKKDATLGGGGGGNTASHTGASSVASNNIIAVPFQIVNTSEGIYTEYVRQLREAQMRVQAEELRQEYLRNMAGLEEEKREAELDVAFWKYWD